MTPAETRQLWLAIHRYIGLTTLAFLFIAAVTGCVLVLGKPLDAALNPDLFRRPVTAPPIEPFAAVAAFEAARPDLHVTAVPLHPAPGETLLVSVDGRDPARPPGFSQAFLDSGGRLVGTRRIAPGWDRRHFVEGVFEFHYTLLAGKWGRWLMGLMALAWLISNLVGLYLTLPLRGPFWKNWKKTWTVNFKAKIAKLFLELHQATGLWLLIPLTVLAFTSVAMNFFDEAFTPAVQAISPARASPFDRPAPPLKPGTAIGFKKAVEAGGAEAMRRGLSWRPAQVGYLPDRDLYQVTFTRSGVVNYSRLGPVSYYLAGADGRFVYEDSPYADSGGRKLSRALYPLHTGQVAGWIGEAVVFILGLITVEQCVTGAYLW
ncbi:MAG: peptidase, partial [Caulobacteraceae bacterium]|nr:peptidase [Caulobacteraceae bacterium]